MKINYYYVDDLIQKSDYGSERAFFLDKKPFTRRNWQVSRELNKDLKYSSIDIIANKLKVAINEILVDRVNENQVKENTEIYKHLSKDQKTDQRLTTLENQVSLILSILTEKNQ